MIAAPVSSVYPNMGGQVLIISFVVVVIGGIGSVRGALLASLLVGLVDTFGKVFFPEAAGVLVYLLMAMILLWKPEGLFGRDDESIRVHRCRCSCCWSLLRCFRSSARSITSIW